MKKEFTYLTFLFLIIFSCKTFEIENKKTYKKINEKNIIINRDNCVSAIYINKKTKKKLNGKYKIKGGYKTIYTNFTNGLFNGKYQEIHKFDNNLYRTKSYFIKGNKYGIEEEYFNNKLFRKCNYVNNVKLNKEYFFDKKNGNTLDVISHYYDPNYTKPNFYKLKFSETMFFTTFFLSIYGEDDEIEKKINEMKPYYRHSTFIGKLKLEGKNHYTYYSSNFNLNDFFYVPNNYNCKNITCIIEINNVYFLGFAEFGDSLYLYELENKP